MQKIIYWLALLSFILSNPIAASAAPNDYFVEIGTKYTEQEAKTQWQKLKREYPGLMADLQFFPVTVDGDGTRIQAGPFPAKLDAYRLCGELLDHNVPCSIAEGARHNVANAVKEPGRPVQKEEMVDLPWLKDTPAAIIVDQETLPGSKEEGSSLFSWLFGDDEDDAATVRTDAQGEVEVAEAINVPITHDIDALTLAPSFQNIQATPPAPKLPDIRPDTGAPVKSGWLNIGSFETDSHASKFWKTVRDSDPVPSAGLRVRITRPLIDSSNPSVSLNLGPFADRKDAMDFCHNSVQSKDEGLSCSFIQKEPEEALSKLVTPRFSQGERYEKRRRMLDPNLRPRANFFGSRTPEKVYWVQIAARQSQLEALKAWEELKEQHADLLGDKRSNISATLMHEANYMVRVGPLESSKDATELCASLTGRGVPCRVYSNM